MMNKIKRYLVIYDGASEEVSELIALENYDLDVLKSAFDVPPTDPDMHDRYAVGPDEVGIISRYCAKRDSDYDFSKYAYFIEAIIDDFHRV